MADTPAGSAPASPAAPATPASATATPSASGTQSSTPQGSQSAPPGEPPQERWGDILENTRKKTRAEVEQEYKQRYGHYDEFERNPLAGVKNWVAEASQHELYGPLVKEWIKQQYESIQPRHQQVGEEPKADVPVVDANGNITGYTYSDKTLRQWQQWNEQRLLGTLEERFGTLEQSNAQREQREQFFQIQQEAHQHASSVLGELRTQPYFKEHEPAIKQALMEHPEWGDNVHAAYTHVLVSQILPNLSQAEQRQAVQSLTGKGAGSSVAPGGTAPAAPKFKNFREAAEYYEQHPAEAEAMANR